MQIIIVYSPTDYRDINFVGVFIGQSTNRNYQNKNSLEN